MPVSYNRINFKNRVVQYPRSYSESNNAGGGITHAPVPGEVVQGGTALNETNLNTLDKGIEDCAKAINAVEPRVSNLETEMTRAKTRIGDNERAILAIQRVDEAQSTNISELTEAHNQLCDDVEAMEADLNGKINAHKNDSTNPHKTTKAQVGLGNVPNVTTNDQTPTYTEAASDANLASGEKLSVAFGKLARAVKSLWAHIANKSNPHATTKAQVGLGNVPNVTTNDQTPTYTEAASLQELTSGEKLSAAFGKLAFLVKNFRSHIADTSIHALNNYFDVLTRTFPDEALVPDVNSTYTGNGNGTISVNGKSCSGQYIDLGFQPQCVAILQFATQFTGGMDEEHMKSLDQACMLGRLTGCVIITPGSNFYHSGCGTSMATAAPQVMLDKKHGGAAIYATGFVVQNAPSQGITINAKGVKYRYLAWRYH